MLNSWAVLIVVVLLTLALSLFAVYRFRRFAIARGLIDNPSARSSHQVATPRGGGLMFVVVWALAAVLFALIGAWPFNHVLALIPGALFVAALSCVIFLGGIDTLILGDFAMRIGWLGAVLAVLAIVWSINLFNFMAPTA